MAKVVIGAEIKMEGMQQAEQSVGSFKKQLREATAELVSMSEKFGLSSVEATNAAKKVAGLKDAIGDAKALSDTFNPDKKFVALGGALQGAVGGFTALTGAMGLFGGESEEVQKMLIKVQSAMALQQGISGVMGAVDSFKLLAAGIMKSSLFMKANNAVTVIAASVTKLFGGAVTQTSMSFKVLKGAIAATGIGLLIVLIGEAVSAFNDLTTATERSAEAQKKYDAGLVESSKKTLATLTQRAELEKNLAIASAKTDDEKFKIEQDYRRKVFALTTDHYNKVKALDESAGEEGLNALNKLNNEGQVAAINDEKRKQKIAEDAAKERLAKQKENNEKQKALQKQHLEDLKAIEENRIIQQNATDELIAENRLAHIKDEYFKQQAEIDKARQDDIDKLNDSLNKKLISEQDYYNRLYYINDTFDTQQQALADEKAAKDAEALAVKKEKDLQEKEAARMQMVTDAQTDAELRLAIAEQINEINPEDTPEGAALKIENIEAAKLAAEQAAFEVKILQAQGNNERIRLLTEQHENNIKGIVKSSTDAQILYERQMNQAKMDAAISYAGKVSGLLDSISETVGKNTAEGKALSIASATIQAITGAVQAYTGMTTIPVVGVALGVVAAAAALAAGFANVKKIANTKVPGKYGGGSSAVSVPSAPSLPPSLIPKTPTMLGSANTSLDQNSINSIGNAAARVFVLQSDITNNQEIITRINRAARIN